MSFSQWITVAAVAFLPLAATAQQAQPNPTDANAVVAETTYVSAFKNYLTTPDETATPDQVWRAANEQVAQGDPHAGHGAMPGMKAQPHPHAGHGASMATPKASTAQPDPHAGHGTMPGMKPQPDPHAGPGGAMAAPKASAAQPDPHAGHNMQGK